MAIIPYGNSTLTNTYYATVGTSWTLNSAGYYTQTVSVAGITSSDEPVIDVVTSLSGYIDELTAWNSIFKVITNNGSITLYASEATTTEIDLQLKVVR